MNDQTTIVIGGMAIQLRSSDPAFVQSLRNHYEAFARDECSPDAEFDIELVAPGVLGGDEDIAVERSGDEWLLSRGDFRARWNPVTRRGQVKQPANPYSIDTVLRVVHSLILAKRGSFLLHAASAIRNGKAYIFTGLSGAGKTTISRMAPKDVTLLTDEISYIRRDGDTYMAAGTPFAGELARVGADVSAPIERVHILVQGPENRIEEVDPVKATRLLMRNVLFFAQDEALVNSIFASVCDFVERMRVVRLVFRKDPSVWELMQ